MLPPSCTDVKNFHSCSHWLSGWHLALSLHICYRQSFPLEVACHPVMQAFFYWKASGIYCPFFFLSFCYLYLFSFFPLPFSLICFSRELIIFFTGMSFQKIYTTTVQFKEIWVLVVYLWICSCAHEETQKGSAGVPWGEVESVCLKKTMLNYNTAK